MLRSPVSTLAVVVLVLMASGAASAQDQDQDQDQDGTTPTAEADEAGLSPPPPLDWWQTAVIYQIYPRSFKDSDGDGVGDLNGIIEKADHLKELGVSAVWLSPIFRSPMADFGYDISDYTGIDPTFGALEDFQALVNKLTDFGIRVLLDFVPNHTSDRHPWFEKSARREEPYLDYYVWADGRPDPARPSRRLPPNNWISVFGGSAWQWHEGRGQFYLHQFAVGQPDLNYSNPLVAEEMDGVLRTWLSRGVSGFRLDAAPFLVEDEQLRDEPPSGDAEARPSDFAALRHTYTQNLDATYALVARWRRLLDAYAAEAGDNETRLLMVEAYADSEQLMRYFGNSSEPAAHFPFNFALVGLTNESTALEVKDAVDDWMGNMPAGGWPNWVLGNHDQPRVASRMGPELVDAMNMLALLLPGTAVTYNGEELGLEDGPVTWDQTVDPQGRNAGPERFRKFSRDPARTPFQWDDSANAGFSSGGRTWLPVNPNFQVLNAQAQTQVPVSHFHVYRRLVQLRRSAAAQRGGLNIQAPSQKVLAFSRELPDVETLLVAINLGAEDETLDMAAAFGDLPQFLTVLVPSINSGYRIRQQVLSTGMQLPPKASLVLTTKTPQGVQDPQK